MDKKSSQPIRSGHVAMKETKKGNFLLHFGLRHAVGRGELRIKKWRVFRESVKLLSRIPAFGPSDFFGLRSKVVLRSEGYAWAPVSESFDKLREVGVLSYLIYPLFKCFLNA